MRRGCFVPANNPTVTELIYWTFLAALALTLLTGVALALLSAGAWLYSRGEARLPPLPNLSKIKVFTDKAKTEPANDKAITMPRSRA